MTTAIADGTERGNGAAERLLGILAMLATATFGFALAEAVTRARTMDTFIVPPTFGQIVQYAAALAVFAGLALALELGAPPLVSRGGRASRTLRALIRRRFRHGRTSGELGTVEAGLTVSVCIVLIALGLAFATTKSVLAVTMVAIVFLNLKALIGLSRFVGYNTAWSGLIGFVYGLAAGYVLT